MIDTCPGLLSWKPGTPYFILICALDFRLLNLEGFTQVDSPIGSNLIGPSLYKSRGLSQWEAVLMNSTQTLDNVFCVDPGPSKH